MILRVAAFEVKKRLTRISTWVYFAVFFALSVFFVLAAGGAIPGANVDFGTGGKLYLNAPYALCQLIILIGQFGLTITAAIAGQATYQDVEHNTLPLLFTTRLTPKQYLAGRFLGALAVMFLIYPAIGLGAAFALQLPWIDEAKIGPSQPLAYLQPYLTVLLPNLFMTTALFFSLAALLKKMLPVYVGGVVLLIGYLVAVNSSSDVENKDLMALLDPLGIMAVDRLTQYWTVDERNSRLIPLAGVLLTNRLIFTALGAVFLGLAFWRFSPKRSAPKPSEVEAAEPDPKPITAVQTSAPAAQSAVFFSLLRIQLRETVKNVFFLVLIIAGLLFVASSAPEIGKLYGTPTLPVTYEVLQVAGASFAIFILVITIFYSGELIWRERDLGMAQMFDALPVKSGVVFAAKLSAMLLIHILLLGIVLVTGVIIQAAKGYFDFELSLYVRELFGLRLIGLWLMGVMAFFLHTLVNHKYLGHLAMILYFIIGIALPAFGFEHYLYRYAATPPWIYSSMNDYGHHLQPVLWFRFYWLWFGVVLILATHLLWVRGFRSHFRDRINMAKSRLTGRIKIALVTALTAHVAIGIFIYWNTNVLNEYLTSDDREQAKADYEKKYSEWQTKALPRVVKVTARADIYPEERRVATTAQMTLQNKTDQPITQVFVSVSPLARIETLSLDQDFTTSLKDPRLGVYILDVQRALEPGEELTLDFAAAYENPGFPNHDPNDRIVANGTFIDSEYFPSAGYRWGEEITDETKRRKLGLPAKPRMPDLDDVRAQQDSYVISDADWMSFSATVSTSKDQLAIAPGYLKRTWIEGDRAYSHYDMGSLIWHFYAFLSAKYVTKKDRWNDVAIEINYHPGHTWNIDRMIEGVKASLEYFTAEFSPYQHKLVRIVEFPRYDMFAQAFPNTIPFSESIGFIADIDPEDPDSVDYPLYVTAHEVAHQWWGHQVIGAHVQGATLLSESLAQYSALMVMKKKFGPQKMRRFLRFELDRYLSGRGRERVRELPLLRVEDQNYIHYNKGSLITYAFADLVGEQAFNAVLRRLIEKFAFTGPPYPTSRDLIALLHQTFPEHKTLIEDWFERITVYELRATEAKAKKLADGRYEVTLSTEAKKYHAGELGTETEVPLDDPIDVGLLDEEDLPIQLKKERISAKDGKFTWIVAELPAKAGIDPLNKLIDRLPDDNSIAIELARE